MEKPVKLNLPSERRNLENFMRDSFWDTGKHCLVEASWCFSVEFECPHFFVHSYEQTALL